MNTTPKTYDPLVLDTMCQMIGWPHARQADHAICRGMAQTTDDPLEMVCAEYVWDHLCGEPEEWSPEEMATEYARILGLSE